MRNFSAIHSIYRAFAQNGKFSRYTPYFQDYLPKIESFSEKCPIFGILCKMKEIRKECPIFGISAQNKKLYSKTPYFREFVLNAKFSN